MGTGMQHDHDNQTVTQLLASIANGDQAAAEELFPIVYDELHRRAASYMRGERIDHTLQTTALIHEAFVRLVGPPSGSTEFQNLEHFLATASVVMRRVLVNHAKARATEKRGGDRSRTSLDLVSPLFDERAIDLIALDDALQELEQLDQQQHRLVELRFFGGLTVEQCGSLLGMSERNVYYEWAHAKAWLRSRIEGPE